VNELLHQIVAEALEREDDERLELVTVTDVAVESDLRHAVVYVSTLDERDQEAALEALDEARIRLQRAIGREARIKRTPELSFRPDDVIRSAERIEEILRHLDDDSQR
jgi:ribosome-binding factor A